MEVLKGNLNFASSYSIPKYVAEDDGVHLKYNILNYEDEVIAAHDELILPKEAFVAAYNAYIKGE